MTRAFWTFKDLAIAVALLLPALLAGGLIARFIPAQRPLQDLASQMVMYLVWFVLLRLLFRITYERPLLPSLGWTNNGWLLACVAGGVALAFAVGWLASALNAPLIDPPYKELLGQRRLLLLFALAGVVFGPIMEELAFRGLIMTLFAKNVPGLLAAVAAAVPFALMHGPGYQWSWQHLVAVFAAGCVFGFVRYWLDSTMASAATHSAYNLTFLAGYIANG